MRNCVVLLALLASACTTTPPQDELVYGGERDADGKADSNSEALELTHIDAPFSPERQQWGGTLLIRSRNEWLRELGSEPPPEIDFRVEWAAFFGVGWRNTDGNEAVISGVYRSKSNNSITIVTQQTMPAFTDECDLTLFRSSPHDMVKFAKPNPAPSNWYSGPGVRVQCPQ